MAVPKSLKDKLEQYLQEQGGTSLKIKGGSSGLYQLAIGNLPFEPSQEQNACLLKLCSYLDRDESDTVFLLKGTAGSGKTSIISATVKASLSQGKLVQLVAPTGRAAKVLSIKSQKSASTIHRLIFKVVERKDKHGNVKGFYFEPKKNTNKKPSVFVVDEASMIATSQALKEKNLLFEQKDLLQNLLDFVFNANPKNKAIFVGDSFQLPPVGQSESEALLGETFKKRGFFAEEFALSTSRRQQAYSAVIDTAAEIRELISNSDWQQSFSPLWTEGQLEWISSRKKAAELFADKYFENPDEVIFLSYSNKNASEMNKLIRQVIWGKDIDRPRGGDKIMVVRNHYFSREGAIHLIANGEQGFIDELDWDSTKEIASHSFAKASLELEDPERGPYLYKSMVNLDLFDNAKPSLDPEIYQLLFSMAKRNKLKDWEFERALELKYGYAITGHKAQGGEWNSVFVLLDAPSRNAAIYNRWFYTAITRAKSELYLVSPS